MSFWPVRYSQKAVLYSFLVTFGISLFYIEYIMPTGYLIIGLTIIILFFAGLHYYPELWNNIDSIRVFERKLFLHSFFFRLAFVLYMLVLTYFADPGNFPMEFGADDSWNYHRKAIQLVTVNFSSYFDTLGELAKTRSDYGFIIYLSIIYKIFGTHPLLVKIFNCIFGSITVVLLSRISGMLFSKDHAKLTGILAMIFPSLLWFCTFNLKETIMIFLIVTTLFYAVSMFEKKKLSITGVIIILFFTFFLFYFRTVLAITVITSILFYYGVNSIKRPSIVKFIVFSLIIFGIFSIVIQSTVIRDVYDVYNKSRSENAFIGTLQTNKDLVGNVNYDEAFVAPFIVIGSFFTPFPSFLVTEQRQIGIVMHFQNEMIRNLLYYFALIGIIIMVINHANKSSLLIFYIISNLYILTVSTTSFQDRFHLPLVPIIIIAISLGIIDSNFKWKKMWNYYLIVLFIAQLSWTIFKLSIRGL